jgi:curved DNA-binding protein CbpA
MGGGVSVPQAHARIYQNLLAIQAPTTRAQMIQTMLASPEHVATMKATGVYGHLLHYTQTVSRGEAAPKLPGEAQKPSAKPNPNTTLTVSQTQVGTGADRAMNYFSACLRILGLEEEVALTDELLKAAYKTSAKRAHPDKGGSEKEFEAVTKAYAYLGEILRRINGGRTTASKVEAPAALAAGREATAFKHVEPVRLNPKNLDLNSFNKLFEETRLPDPDETGYGDWLKGEEAGGPGAKFSGKFNRDVFHKAFEEEQQAKATRDTRSMVARPQELSLAAGLRYGVELGRTGRDDYTMAANEAGLKYTDLKKAYTSDSTFSHQTAGVRVEARSFDQYSQGRDKAPPPLADHEMAEIAAAEKAAARAEEARRLRVAQQAVEENSYAERLKRLVIRN